MTEVEAFVHGHLQADAELAVAALGEPDDDAYLAVEERAKAFYQPGSSSLAPTETRWARPGGTSPAATIDVRDSVQPGVLYAVASVPDGWIAVVGDKRDVAGALVAEALLIRATPDGLRITGRAALDPFARDESWEAADGESVDIGTAVAVEVLREPTLPAHQALLRRWSER